jgi:cyclic pyranopterin phosphate synthase
MPKPRKPGRPTHVVRGRSGRESRMVDVGAKPATRRAAEARALVVFPRGVLVRILAGRGPKGPVTEVARTAAVLAAKRTDAIVPLCHSIPLDAVTVDFRRAGADRLEIRVRAACTGRTGVEMEALVGASVAALTVYDMSKALDHGIRIERVELIAKSGGLSGPWRARRQAR